MDYDVYASRVRGCLLGGAVGDALGAPVEFWPLARIVGECGDGGVRSYLPARFGAVHRRGLITDDTQMTLFAVEGIIRACVREDRGIGFTVAVTHHAFLRWLDTQQNPGPTGSRDGWLQGEQWLYSQRAPGNTCLSALRAGNQFGVEAANDSKGCGGVMRSAPFGLLAPRFDADACFAMAAESAGYTHGHITGQLASGALASVVAMLVSGEGLETAVDATRDRLRREEGHEETSDALSRAVAAVGGSRPSAAVVESLGGGWVAEEALGIAVYAALAYPRPEQMLDALALAVTHSGDSDSTGAICGNILGALHGVSAVPAELAFEVEGRATILELADDLVLEVTAGERLHGDHGPTTRWTERYPGW